MARETMRLHSNTNRGVFRKVLVEGIKTEDGIELPKGAYVSFLGRPLQCNPETFEDSFKYDPSRFSRVREKAPRDEKGRSITSNLSFVSTSPEHLPFGHGGHSCPVSEVSNMWKTKLSQMGKNQNVYTSTVFSETSLVLDILCCITL
ncbi:hypothetical protein ACN42_g1684 [Penicillium freii]|uniref:Uncharacterized protein n=1 Tax=Penicillium freii TaxID=48697 RepID=A0A101MRI5_PENFR|nr:hypothetical protein ACN42_g1684 [Penicillium freii]